MMKNMKYVLALSLLFSTALRAENDISDILAQLAALKAQMAELQARQSSLKSEVANTTTWRQNTVAALMDAFLFNYGEDFFVETSTKFKELEAAGELNLREKKAHDHFIRVHEAIFGQTMDKLFSSVSVVKDAIAVDTKTQVKLASDDSAALEQAAGDQTSKD